MREIPVKTEIKCSEVQRCPVHEWLEPSLCTFVYACILVFRGIKADQV